MSTYQHTFVYTVDGEPFTGTVEDYATALQAAHYAGLSVSEHIWVVKAQSPKPELFRTAPRVTRTPYNDNDWASVTVAYGDDEATVYIDGRA